MAKKRGNLLRGLKLDAAKKARTPRTYSQYQKISGYDVEGEDELIKRLLAEKKKSSEILAEVRKLRKDILANLKVKRIKRRRRKRKSGKSGESSIL